MRKIMLFLLACLVMNAMYAKKNNAKYRIYLTDKEKTTYSLDRPEEFLSERALERRRIQGLALDSTDLPVCEEYIHEIVRKGVRLKVKGKWENFITVSGKEKIIKKIAKLPFVRDVEKVWMNTVTESTVLEREPIFTEENQYEHYYGIAEDQIKLNNGDYLHTLGYKGKGVQIAVVDAGFHNLDRIPLLDNLDVLGVKDFVDPKSNLFLLNSHGLSVLSCIGMNKPNVYVGTAPEASFWLLRSEDEDSEHLVEQDYWSAAVEFADSVGVDIINSSLGYYAFDDSIKNYTFRDLTGEYALISKQASRLADKGIVLVTSAGNSGKGSWKKITPPADAKDVLTVGAVDEQRELAPFSSIGNTTDGRIKPDIVSFGFSTRVVGENGVIKTAHGTSFSTPIISGLVACLREAFPKLTAKQLIHVVKESGDRSCFPDNIYGFGIPNFEVAYRLAKELEE